MYIELPITKNAYIRTLECVQPDPTDLRSSARASMSGVLVIRSDR